MFVELFGPLMQRMHEQRSHSGVLRDRERAIHGVLQEGRAEMLPLHAPAYGKPSQHHDRQGVRHITANTGGCELVRNGTCCQCVVSANSPVRIDDDKRSTGAANLVGQGSALEPIIEFGFAALKVIQAVRRR